MKATKSSFGIFTDTSLRLGLHGAFAPDHTSGKNDKNHGPADGSASFVSEPFLGLVLGSNGSSIASKVPLVENGSTVVTLERDTDGQPPVDLSLGLNLHLKHNGEGLSSASMAQATKKLDIDLELSLSTAAESDVTSLTHASSPVLNGMDILPPSSGVGQLVDEGSTSSKWRRGPLVIPLQDLGLTNESVLDCSPSNVNSTLLTPGTISGCVAQLDTPPSAVNLHPNHQRKTSVKPCQFPGCERGARGASGRCISHGGGRRCQRVGCGRGAEGKTAFCKAHGGGQRCDYLGCTKSAEGRTNLCISHGGGRRCSYPEGCTRAARGKSGLCIRHGGGKRCKIDNCTKSAEGLSGLCIAHGGGRRCQYPACTRGAQGSTKFCKAHGGGKRCTYPLCTRGAEGSTPYCKGHGGGKRCTFQGGGVCSKSVHGGTLFCVAHGGGKRCAIPECTRSARGRTNYCVCHGGGKRCKHEDCGKSAQGSTDFCKAHGGGKRCSWCQPGSGYGADDVVHCNKFARGKLGLCVAHAAQVEDVRVHGNGTAGIMLQDPKPMKMKEAAIEDNPRDAMMILSCEGFPSGWSSLNFSGPESQPLSVANDHFMAGTSVAPAQSSLPEGRVHGGGLMALLRGHAGSGSSVLYC
ncbi:putative WRKY transcription factor 19 [Drosera capensis]